MNETLARSADTASTQSHLSLSIYLPTYLPIYLSVHLSIYLYMYTDAGRYEDVC